MNWTDEKNFKIEQLRCDCHRPAPRACSPRSASPSRRCPGASGLIPGASFAFSRQMIKYLNQTGVDRDKPRTLDFGLWFMDFGLLLWTKDDSGLPTKPLNISKTLTHFFGKGLTAYVNSLYSTYLVVLIRLSYDDSIYLVIENMTYDWRFNM